MGRLVFPSCLGGTEQQPRNRNLVRSPELVKTRRSLQFRSLADAAVDFGLQILAQRFGDNAWGGEFSQVGDSEFGEVSKHGGER